jgi:hypothetical protein
VPRPRAADDFTAIRARMEELRPVRRPRAADDFETIRGRMEELRRERAAVRTDEARGSDRPRTSAVSSSASTKKSGLSPALRRMLLRGGSA